MELREIEQSRSLRLWREWIVWELVGGGKKKMKIKIKWESLRQKHAPNVNLKSLSLRQLFASKRPKKLSFVISKMCGFLFFSLEFQYVFVTKRMKALDKRDRNQNHLFDRLQSRDFPAPQLNNEPACLAGGGWGGGVLFQGCLAPVEPLNHPNTNSLEPP